MALISNTDLALINTNTNSGTITLPASATSQGRVITFKDIQGTFQRNTLTLQTSGSDTFEDNSTSKILRESYGSIQIVASGNKWYLLNGTQVNTVQTSTLFVDSISSFNISTINANISTLKFIDNRFSTNQLNISTAFLSTQNVSTNFLYYNNYVIAGTRVGYSNRLSSSQFSLYNVASLALWLDGADPTSIVLGTGSNVATWKDKSGYNNNSIQTIAGSRPVYNASINGIVYNNNSYMLIPSNSIRQFNPVNIFAVINIPTISGGYFNNIFRKGSGSPIWAFEFFFRILVTSGVATIDVQVGSSVTTTFFGGSVYTFNSIQLIGLFTNETSGYIMNNGTISSAGGKVTQQFGPSVTGVGCRPLNNDGTAITELFIGTMHELIILNQLPTVAIRQQIEGYLAWKWGIQANLPASHPFKNAPPP